MANIHSNKELDTGVFGIYIVPVEIEGESNLQNFTVRRLILKVDTDNGKAEQLIIPEEFVPEFKRYLLDYMDIKDPKNG